MLGLVSVDSNPPLKYKADITAQLPDSVSDVIVISLCTHPTFQDNFDLIP